MSSSGVFAHRLRARPARGAVLLLALVFMLLLAMVAATVMQTAILQLHMAGNDQLMEEAHHRAQAIADELSQNPGNFPLAGAVGDIHCPSGDQSPDCSTASLPRPASAEAPEGVALSYRVIRQDPLLWRGFPLRESQAIASSSNSFDAALFEIDVRVDGRAMRLGSAHIVQGIAVRVPASRWDRE